MIFVFGAMRDKAISEMTEILFPLAETGNRDASGQSALGDADEIRAGRGPDVDGNRSRGRAFPPRLSERKALAGAGMDWSWLPVPYTLLEKRCVSLGVRI